jgi:isoprenylcysteine carboxyl methyltransferase (ICMT) family protein YpbQ
MHGGFAAPFRHYNRRAIPHPYRWANVIAALINISLINIRKLVLLVVVLVILAFLMRKYIGNRR